LTRALVAHRALDEIARRIVDVADSAEVLQEVVDTASDLLDSDGAHLTLINDDRTALRPIVVAATPNRPFGRGFEHSVSRSAAASTAWPPWSARQCGRQTTAPIVAGRTTPMTTRLIAWSSAQ
jgi:hypothetical protein